VSNYQGDLPWPPRHNGGTRNRKPEAARPIGAFLLTTLLLGVSAQNVGSLRQASFDLPQTDLDREVLTLVCTRICSHSRC
jgi:hypothetical protein